MPNTIKKCNPENPQYDILYIYLMYVYLCLVYGYVGNMHFWFYFVFYNILLFLILFAVKKILFLIAPPV